MAITDAVVTKDVYKREVDITDSRHDADIERGLDAATEWWWNKTGQFFVKDAAAVERLFIAKWSDRLDLDYEGNCPGIATISAPNVPVIKVDTDGDSSFADETAWTAADYMLEPLQAAQGPNPRPWNVIKTRRGGARSFIPGSSVSVLAVWGWPTVPALVKEGVIEWLAVWRGESIRTTARVNELDQVESVSPFHLGMINKIIAACTTNKVTL